MHGARSLRGRAGKGSAASGVRMTPATNRPTIRELSACNKGRPLVIEVFPGYLTLREKGRRFKVSVDYQSVLHLGYKKLANEKKAQRKARA